jgi:hypothetical protein
VMKPTNCSIFWCKGDGDNVHCVVSTSLEFWRVILNTRKLNTYALGHVVN